MDILRTYILSWLCIYLFLIFWEICELLHLLKAKTCSWFTEGNTDDKQSLDSKRAIFKGFWNSLVEAKSKSCYKPKSLLCYCILLISSESLILDYSSVHKKNVMLSHRKHITIYSSYVYICVLLLQESVAHAVSAEDLQTAETTFLRGSSTVPLSKQRSAPMYVVSTFLYIL